MGLGFKLLGCVITHVNLFKALAEIKENIHQFAWLYENDDYWSVFFLKSNKDQKLLIVQKWILTFGIVMRRKITVFSFGTVTMQYNFLLLFRTLNMLNI